MAGGEAAAAAGFYVAVALSGSELKAPKQTSETDLDLFSGIGLAPAFGYGNGRFRVEMEVNLHASTALGLSDRIGVRAIMANGYLDMALPKRFAILLGAGTGTARVHVDLGTCLNERGCPMFQDTETTESAAAYQYMLGVGWSPRPRHEIFLIYRRFYTRDLGIVNAAGAPFAEDHVDMPTALLGYRWDF